MKDIYIKKTDVNSWIAKYFDKDLISVDDLINKIEDLDGEIDSLKEKLEDMKQDIEENHQRVSVSSQVGINDRDFI